MRDSVRGVEPMSSRSSSIVAHSEDFDEEPWDQQSAGSSFTPLQTKSTETTDIRAASGDYDDPGEPPSLTPPRGMGGRMVNGQRTTTRPLSPPSTAGLRSENTRQFWDQMDNERTDGPDDEVAAYRREEELKSESYEATLGYSLSGETVESAEQDAPYCGQTLAAISELCGGGLESGPESRQESERRQQRSPRADYEDTEEQTAIEVEYVEPVKDMSPQKKNAYLTAMAKKARSSFIPTSSNRSRAVSPSPEVDLSAQDDVYAGLSASEKRTFLKLINSGSGPAEAHRAILADREQMKVETKTQPPGPGSVSSGTSPGSTPTRRSKRLAFWKANGIGKSQSSKTPTKSPKHATPKASSNDVGGKTKSKVVAAAAGVAAAGLAGAAVATKRPDVQLQNDTSAVDRSHGPVATTNQAAEGKKTSDVTGMTVVETDSSEDEGFKKFGVNYYDAVRKDEGAIPDEVQTRPTKETRLKALKARNMRRGFSELKEPGSTEKRISTPASFVSREKDGRGIPESSPVNPNVNDGEVEPEVPPSHPRAPISAKDASVMERIEKELMRPVKRIEQEEVRNDPLDLNVQATSQTATSLEEFVTKESQPFSDEKALPSPPPTPLRAKADVTRDMSSADARKLSSVDVDDGMDVDMDTYLNSTEFYSLAGGDAASVYSAGTGVTGQSGFTQSSRMRRPGAAKERLMRSKDANGKKVKGWHDSILAAAKSTNRKWDAEKGWVDYHEPKVNDVSDEVLMEDKNERLHLTLPKHAHGRQVEEDEAPATAPVKVPFPSEWEEDRSEMVMETEELNDRAIAEDTAHWAATAKEDTKHPKRSGGNVPRGAANSRTLSSIGRPQGWIASMQAASAALGKGGRKWDPEKGWTSFEDKEEGNVPDIVDFNDPPTVAELNAVQSDIAQREETGLSSTPRSLHEEGSVQASSQMVVDQESDALHSEESVDRLGITRTSSDPYLQIADSGNVEEMEDIGNQKDPTPRRPPESDDDAQVVSVGGEGAFPSFSTSPHPAVTGIVKEKVGDEDMGLFSDTEQRTPDKPRTTIPVDLDDIIDDLQPENEGNSARGLDHHGEAVIDLVARVAVSPDARTKDDSINSVSRGSGRRGNGPVDLDESDIDSESSEDDAQAWDASSYPISSLGGPASVNSSLPLKKVPRLGGPKRDTSPIRRKTADLDSTPALTNTREFVDRSRPRQADATRPRQPDISSSPVNKLKKVDETVKNGGLSDQYIADDPIVAYPAIVTPTSTRNGTSLPPAILAEDEDSLFEFADQKSSVSQPTGLEQTKLSPIRRHSDEDELEESVVYGSEAYGPEPGEHKSFFSRFVECNAPSLPAKGGKGNAGQSQHLNFLRNQPGFCARPDGVVDANRSYVDSSELEQQVAVARKETGNINTSDGASSVISGDFGAKTAYLDAIAMKAAVSKPKRSGSRSRGTRSGSSVVSSSSQHSEKWRAFLERKKSKHDSTDAASESSKAVAEKYASKKVDEMMTSISRTDDEMNNNSSKGTNEKSSTVEAAEHLAAARVQAMMSALSSSPDAIEEAEI